MKKYAHIILPLALDQVYTYEIPANLAEQAQVGCRVEVQFGKKKVYAGVIKNIFEKEELAFKAKPINNVLDEARIVVDKQLQLWEWMASYYMCSQGAVMNVAMPSAFKLSSETKLSLNPSFNQDFSLLNDNEYLVAEALSVQDEITIQDVQAILDRKNVFYVIKSLVHKAVILVKEELIERYKPKVATFINLQEIYQKDEAKLSEEFDKLSKAPKQMAVLMAYVQMSNSSGKQWIERGALVKKAGAATTHVKPLVKKGILQEQKQQVSRLDEIYEEETISYELTPHQEKALGELRASLEKFSVSLLHGITSSGKTQLYIQLMEEAVKRGQQVLFLLPEIALTGQMIHRLKKVFGNTVGVYHSKFNDNERIEIWQKVLHNEYKVVVGARSSLFLPFADLGLVIVDEEHDHSYKQFDPAPRYHARDTAIYLAYLYGAKTVIGSATPALESYYNATKGGKYGLVTMTERYGGVAPPEIELVNLYEAKKRKELKSHFSKKLLTEIQGALNKQEQVIIFQNRRGYSPYMICSSCGWIPQCYQCDVSLTYHKFSNDLRCHYCGYSKKLVSNCESCASTHIQIQGFGTEKIEDELQIYFPDAKIGRLDLDVTRTKKGHERIIKQFEERMIDILVGTQMVTKGLDFDNVSIVGIVSADQLINFPDFRSAERAFQMMLQVSGRAGRREKQGKVLIQAMKTNHKVLDYVTMNDYRSMFFNELQERLRFQYPPFNRLVRLSLKHKESSKVNQASFELTNLLKIKLGKKVLGPTVPHVSRVRSYFIRQVLVKIDKKQSLLESKNYILKCIADLKGQKDFKSVIVQTDVDPY